MSSRLAPGRARRALAFHGAKPERLAVARDSILKGRLRRLGTVVA